MDDRRRKQNIVYIQLELVNTQIYQTNSDGPRLSMDSVRRFFFDVIGDKTYHVIFNYYLAGIVFTIEILRKNKRQGNRVVPFSIRTYTEVLC